MQEDGEVRVMPLDSEQIYAAVMCRLGCRQRVCQAESQLAALFLSPTPPRSNLQAGTLACLSLRHSLSLR